jgi:hypothetical protein
VNEIQLIDETKLEEFRVGYSDILVKHFASDFDWSEDFTRLVLRDALRFLSVCSISTSSIESTSHRESQVMVSSPIVDRVVDALLLDTLLLMWLEREVFHSRFVHVPSYSHGIIDPAINNMRYEFTISLMQAAGYELDRDVIWPVRLPEGYLTCGNRNDVLDCEAWFIPLQSRGEIQ